MARLEQRWVRLVAMVLIWFLATAAEERLTQEAFISKGVASNRSLREVGLFWQKQKQGYKHVWPEMRFGWRIVLGAIIGFLGAAFGSVGGVGGGGIFVPMLALIIGFDPKSSTAISKCMIMGASASTVLYNIGLKHPTLDLPIIDYDLALLFQPMLVLGISVGVAFNVIFADWMITVLLIVLFLVMSAKAFLKGVEAWKKETKTKKEARGSLQTNDNGNEVAGSNSAGDHMVDNTDVQRDNKEATTSTKGSIIHNIYWKEFSVLVAVWVIVLVLQIVKNNTVTCSWQYWVLNLSQIPVAAGVSLYEAVSLYKGRRVIASRGEVGKNWKVYQLFLCCVSGIAAGVVGGLLGLGGGFIMGPVFLELGIPPQVSSATATFIMTFSSSMSVVEYYLLKRFPIPYALYFFAVATIAALAGQHVVRKVIDIIGRASIIIFILALTIFVSAISLGLAWHTWLKRSSKRSTWDSKACVHSFN